MFFSQVLGDNSPLQDAVVATDVADKVAPLSHRLQVVLLTRRTLVRKAAMPGQPVDAAELPVAVLALEDAAVRPGGATERLDHWQNRQRPLFQLLLLLLLRNLGKPLLVVGHRHGVKILEVLLKKDNVL